MIDQNDPIQQYLSGKHDFFRERLTDIAGNDDVRGMEISGMIRLMANLYDSAVAQNESYADLSSARMGILIRLMGEKEWGSSEGMNPTQISKKRNVSKNTVSALLRGLEEQGLVERKLDPSDRRRFLINITPAGEELIWQTVPDRIKFMNLLASGLSQEEKDHLMTLLIKLYQSIVTKTSAAQSNLENDGTTS